MGRGLQGRALARKIRIGDVLVAFEVLVYGWTGVLIWWHHSMFAGILIQMALQRWRLAAFLHSDLEGADRECDLRLISAMLSKNML
jgi:hypothetical protein